MSKRKVKILVSLIAGCLLLIAALSVIPIWQETTTEFTGAVVTADGEILEMTDITYTEDTLNYLLRDRKEDKVRFFINADNSDWNITASQSRRKFGDLFDPFRLDLPYITHTVLYVHRTDPKADPQTGYFAVSLEHGYSIAGARHYPEKFLIGSTNENIDSAAILDFFSEWIDTYFSED